MIGTIVGGIVSVVSGFFGMKNKKSELVDTALSVVKSVDASNAQREGAIATIISAEATSGYWLAAIWRPMLMLVFATIIITFWFGYTPSNLEGPMPPMIGEIFGLLKIGIGGYIGGRTIEKILKSINLNGVLKKFLDKR